MSDEIKKIFESKVSFRILCAIGIAIVTLLVFAAGVIVGFSRATYEHAWEENYERNFGMRSGHPILENFPNAHGAIGKIISISLPTIIVEDRDNTEKVVVINDDTQIQEMTGSLSSKDLKVDDFVVVIGSP